MTRPVILTLNAGSSSIKFAVFLLGVEPEEIVRGQVENIGPQARLIVTKAGEFKETFDLGPADHDRALRRIIETCRAHIGEAQIAGVGHRIAHGGPDLLGPARLDAETIAKLTSLEPLAPLHQPHNLAAVAAAQSVFPDALQIGCFDTSFHRGHPWVNDTFALPRRLYTQGVRRYGFHGLSYDYVTGELKRVAPELAGGRVVIAHLGNGASMCAVRDGRSVASTMGFSALDGLPMGTRCGQLDPGVLLYLMQTENLDAGQISDLLYKESGLKGLSSMTHDLRTLEASDAPEAKEAIDYFVFRIRREIGAMAAVLGGLDGVIFCGGIGENSQFVRSRVCEDMGWLGIALDEERNAANAARIESGRVPVLIIPTNEERVIARAVAAALPAAR